MWKALLALALVLAAAALPTAGAQAPSDGSAEDPTGDVQSTNAVGPPVMFAAGSADGADLVKGDIEATSDALVARLEFVGTAVPPNMVRGYGVYFRHGAVEYLAGFHGGSCATLASGGAGNWKQQSCIEETLDNGGAIVELRVPLTSVVNETQVPLQPGSLIEEVHFEGFVIQPGMAMPPLPTITLGRDRAPDVDPLAAIAIPSVHGRGPVFLSMPNPLRVSNGEATTIVFPVDVTNRGTQSLDAFLEASSSSPTMVPEIAGRISVPAGETKRVPLLVTMAFAHKHGATDKVTVIATSSNGDIMDQAEAGVFFLEVPQPSGHHPTVWFHAGASEVSPTRPLNPVQTLWFSAELEDALAVAEESGPSGGDVQANTMHWWFPLQPTLQLGLDVLDEARSVKVAFVSDVPVQGATASAAMYLCPEFAEREDCIAEPENLVLQGAGSAQDIGAGASGSFEFEWSAVEGAATFPYQLGRTLAIEVSLQTQSLAYVGEDGPESIRLLMGESEATLPLREYRDPVEQGFLTGQALALSAVSMVEQQVNPGKTAAFEFQVKNNGSSAVSLEATVVGRELGWVEVEGGGEFRLSAGESRALTVRVTPASDARIGDVADYILIIESRSDASNSVLARFSIQTVEGGVPSAAGAVGDGRESPPVALGLVVLALWAIVSRRR